MMIFYLRLVASSRVNVLSARSARICDAKAAVAALSGDKIELFGN